MVILRLFYAAKYTQVESKEHGKYASGQVIYCLWVLVEH